MQRTGTVTAAPLERVRDLVARWAKRGRRWNTRP